MSKGQTICWCVQDTSKIWKSAEGQETDKEAVRVSWQQRETKDVVRAKSLLLIVNLGI